MPQIAKPHKPISMKLSQPLLDWLDGNPINRTAQIEAAIALLRNESEAAIGGVPTAIERLSAVGVEATPEGLRKIK